MGSYPEERKMRGIVVVLGVVLVVASVWSEAQAQDCVLTGTSIHRYGDGSLDGLSESILDLDRSGREICGIAPGVLDKFVNLQTLRLHDNKITELPNKIFDKLVELQTLWLHVNEISELPNNIFDNLVKLINLVLRGNRISKLPNNIFDNLVNLISLNMKNNKISELPSNIFDNLVKLKTLRLDNNKITELPNNIFDNLVKLHTLFITDNELESFPMGVFDYLEELEFLFFNHNFITAMHERIFQFQSVITYLSYSSNRISKLPNNIFDNLVNLIYLNMKNNKISELPSNIFDNLVDLKTLRLDNNKISELPDNIFDNLVDLKTLSLENNELESFPMGIFDYLEKLESLNFGHNFIVAMHERIFQFQSVLGTLVYSSNILDCNNRQYKISPCTCSQPYQPRSVVGDDEIIRCVFDTSGVERVWIPMVSASSRYFVRDWKFGSVVPVQADYSWRRNVIPFNTNVQYQDIVVNTVAVACFESPCRDDNDIFLDMYTIIDDVGSDLYHKYCRHKITEGLSIHSFYVCAPKHLYVDGEDPDRNPPRNFLVAVCDLADKITAVDINNCGHDTDICTNIGTSIPTFAKILSTDNGGSYTKLFLCPYESGGDRGFRFQVGECNKNPVYSFSVTVHGDIPYYTVDIYDKDDTAFNMLIYLREYDDSRLSIKDEPVEIDLGESFSLGGEDKLFFDLGTGVDEGDYKFKLCASEWKFIKSCRFEPNAPEKLAFDCVHDLA